VIVRRVDGVGGLLEADSFCWFNPSLIHTRAEGRRTRLFPEPWQSFHANLPPGRLDCRLHNGQWINLREAFETGRVVCDDENQRFWEAGHDSF